MRFYNQHYNINIAQMPANLLSKIHISKQKEGINPIWTEYGTNCTNS